MARQANMADAMPTPVVPGDIEIRVQVMLTVEIVK